MKRKFDAHKNTMERLSGELDIEQLIAHMRISKFMARVYLRKNQRDLVKYFSHYHIDAMKPTLEDLEKKHSIDYLMRHFDPKNDKIDKFILYEITGRKQPGEHFDSESEEEYSHEENHNSGEVNL